MTEGIIDRLMESHRDDIRFIGAKHKKILQVKAILGNTKPNPRHLFIAEGIWAHQKLLDAGLTVESFLFAREFLYSPESVALLSAMLERAEEAYCVSERVFSRISERDKPDGLLSIARLPVYDAQNVPASLQTVVVLDGLEIPGNVGTIVRTCDGAAIDAIFICNRRVRLSHPKLVKGSMGAIFNKPVYVFDEVSRCKSWLKEHGFTVYLADTRAEKTYCEHRYRPGTALIVGSERYGITREWYDEDVQMLSIPMLGLNDSLNVGVATSIILYEMSLQIKGLRKCGQP